MCQIVDLAITKTVSVLRVTETIIHNDKVRASRAGHTFHERWAARRALSLVFPKDGLYAIAVEGLSTSETASPGPEAEDIADLVLYYGEGDNFEECSALKTLQFKYKVGATPVTSSYLKKTLQKFADTLTGYEKEFSKEEIQKKLSFSFVTNAEFSHHLWSAIKCLKAGDVPNDKQARQQFNNLKDWCTQRKIDAERLFSITEFSASTDSLGIQNSLLRRTLCDWSAGSGGQAQIRLFGLAELVREKAGLSGQSNNLIKREGVLDALGCYIEDLFPADTRFTDVGTIIERSALQDVARITKTSILPLFIHADGGVGKTVFIQSLAAGLSNDFEVVVFDCFGGGAYRSDDQPRHLPKIGLLQIVNELASRGLCDPLLPGDSDTLGLIKVAKKRLAQAAKTVADQSKKNGVLIVVDAADNAQLEADHRKDEAFPKLLLSALCNEPIEGLRLILTARSHRRGDVIGSNTVEEFKLDPFSEAETKAFLETRRSDVSSVELSTAIARSKGNARVLEYLVESWDRNILGGAPSTEISVEDIIEQKCKKIFEDLHLAGWGDADIREFFTAISLLPPPIPMEELASALGWPETQVNSAISDLAPMLEIVAHGAIFRDEPTETFIREVYSQEVSAQQAISQRLLGSQQGSTYAAEALPRFLVITNDSNRAYQLASSSEFPASIQSEYGRRRLKLARLYAAYTLAVKDKNFDQVLSLSMRLAQVAAANARGDEFIRRAPALATMLGDADASRRLFNDRSGWRGARNARLAIAYSFSEEMEEAIIHQNRAIGWINWNSENKKSTRSSGNSSPDIQDFAAILFISVLQKDYEIADKNLTHWDLRFALDVCGHMIMLSKQYEVTTGINVLNGLADYASNKHCASLALQVSLLANANTLTLKKYKRLARSASTLCQKAKDVFSDNHHDLENVLEGNITNAAFTALIRNSRQSATRILGIVNPLRPSTHDYDDQHGPSRGWVRIFYSCMNAWAAGERVQYYHLLPRQIDAKRRAKRITARSTLMAFLENLKVPEPEHTQEKGKKQKFKRQFSRSDSASIADGIELVLDLIKPIEDALFSNETISDKLLARFLEVWASNLRTNVDWYNQKPTDIICRGVGLGIAILVLRHADNLTEKTADRLIKLISAQCFSLRDRLGVLPFIAYHSNLNDLTGRFAQKLSEEICADESIEERARNYTSLAAAMVAMSKAEAQEYYKQGLQQLDQMGGDDFGFIHSMLRYAAQQPGGFLKPELSHRFMNVCQTIFHHEPSRFTWALFGKAAAKSIGFPAAYKLIRWADQKTADYSYGLPQLACYLAKNKTLDPRRAALLLTLCEDHSWYEWRVGDGLIDILEAAEPCDQRTILSVVFHKLMSEHSGGAYNSLWNSLTTTAEKYPNALDETDWQLLQNLASEGYQRREEKNKRSSSSVESGPLVISDDQDSKKNEAEADCLRIADNCDATSAREIDGCLLAIQDERRFPYGMKKTFLEHLRDKCPYDQRSAFIYALGEVIDLQFDDTIEFVAECVELWKASSIHISKNTKSFVTHVFAYKGSKLFGRQYSDISHEIQQIADLCDDFEFAMKLVLGTIAKEQIKLSGDEWLQVATSLCRLASPQACLTALEDLLSGPAAKIGDEVGEGAYKTSFDIGGDQSNFIANVIWHLLGDSDVVIRWNVSRAIKHFIDLGLNDDLETLIQLFDKTEIPVLCSPDRPFSFQNSQQWFLMGLARATLHHKKKLQFLKPKLYELANRDDVHVIHKLHIARCLSHISEDETLDSELLELWKEINAPLCGSIERNGATKQTESQTNFNFDYEFLQTEIMGLARLFGLSQNQALDAVAIEITNRWPEAEGMEFFPGSVVYKRTSSDRHESYREHIQKHALFSAATKLMQSKPVVCNSYVVYESDPWVEWLGRYDVSFEDGSWLSDNKDLAPKEASAALLKGREGKQEFLHKREELLRKIRLLNAGLNQLVPIYGHWKSEDGVYVKIDTALGARRGVIGQCAALAKLQDHDLWLPEFDADGYDCRQTEREFFEPIIWEPEAYPLGIDNTDELATRGAIKRPRLGIDLTSKLNLISHNDDKEWFDQDGSLALKSLVWGRWVIDHEESRQRFQDEGTLLCASPAWLDEVLSKLNKSLVYHVNFSKSKSHKSYNEASGARAVFVGLRTKDGELRLWDAKKASKVIY